MNKTLEDVLTQHVERMRAISDLERQSTAWLGMLNTLLIYRTATANMAVDKSISALVEKIILESGATPEPGQADLPSVDSAGS